MSHFESIGRFLNVQKVQSQKSSSPISRERLEVLLTKEISGEFISNIGKHACSHFFRTWFLWLTNIMIGLGLNIISNLSTSSSLFRKKNKKFQFQFFKMGKERALI